MRGRGLTLALAMGTLTVLVGCGSSDAPNDPRPPAPVTVSAQIDDEQVSLSPKEVNAGILTFIIANQTDSSTRVHIDSLEQTTVDFLSNPIPAGGTGQLKADFCRSDDPDTRDCKPGEYQVSAEEETASDEGDQSDFSGAGASGVAPEPATLTVGPEGPSAQNDLLQP